MIPWQIYGDYLEERGFDTRLFRISEPEMKLDSDWDLDDSYHEDGDEYGDGGNLEGLIVFNGFGDGMGGTGNGHGFYKD